MVTYKKFWDLIQVGKWRSEAIQLQFYGRIKQILLLTIIGYALIFLYFTFLPKTFPEYPNLFLNFDFFTPASAIWGFIVTFIGISVGFSNYFAYEITKPQILSYFGYIEYKNTKSLITFCNLGETAVIRNISLFALKKKKTILPSSIPILDVTCSTTIFDGWKILKNGDTFRVPERVIKSAMSRIDERIRNENDTDDLDLCLLAFDEEFKRNELEQSINKTMLAGCVMGTYSELIEYAEGRKEGFPIYDKFVRVYESDLKDLENGKRVSVLLVEEYPPDVVDLEFEIYEKLVSIEKILKDREKNDETH